MTWRGISRSRLLDLMREPLAAADETVRAAWERVRIEPEKWRCSPWGDRGGGFWAVAEIAGEVVWYNDVEEGFNTSPFTVRGVIAEYRCSQSRFDEVLRALPEARTAEDFAAGRPSSGVPVELTAAGRIARRQTTYWELEAANGRLVRVHFTGKRETRQAGDAFDHVELHADHPLLDQYRQPWVSVFVTNTERIGDAVEAELNLELARATGGWRAASEYLALGGAGTLRGGFGLLLRAPQPIAALAAEVVDRLGGRASSVPEHGIRPDAGGVKALLLGRSFVVAEAFRFVGR